jgi:hypothetical protein
VANKRKQAKKANEPEVGGDEWYREQQSKPEYIRGVMQDLVRSIAQGSTWAPAALQKWMARHPDVARSLSQLGDLCAASEEAWVRALAGDNPLDQLAVRDQVAAMKAELLGPNPSTLDKILASNVVVAHMAHQGAVTSAARPAPHQAVAAARDRRVESTSRRFLTALKMLAVIRQQRARGVAPRAKLEVFGAGA